MLNALHRCILILFTRIRLKFNTTGRLRLRGVRHPLVFRPKSVDVYTVEEIFIDKEYDIAWPASWGAPRYIIDGGANIGLTSVFFANRYPNASIVAIEPEADNYRCLLQNIQPYPNIRGLQKAIWSTNTFVAVRDRGFGWRGFMVEEVDRQTPGASPTISISDLLGDHQAIDILKLDVEGSEKFIFEHAYEHWLPLVRCLIIELHDRMLPGCTKSVFSAISRYDFSCSTRGTNLVCVNEAPGMRG